MNEESLDLGSGVLTYRRTGDGPLVVFSHALGPPAWGALDRLAASCTVAVPDWERSTVPAETMGGIEWFEALVRGEGRERATLCAWSMAGPAAILYAAERPPALARLVLVDVAGLGPGLPPLRWRDVPHVVVSRLLGRPTRGFVRSLWRNWVRQESVDTAPLVEATVRFFRSEAASASVPMEDGDGEDDLVDRLEAIEVPTLVLVGARSTVLGPRHGKIAAALLPRGERVVFEESSHALQLEEPERFQESVAAFVTRGGGAE